jgi:hypothetical protein
MNMNIRAIHFFALLSAGAALSAVACSSKDAGTTATSSKAATTSTGAGGMTSSTGAGGAAGPNCPGFKDITEDQFVNGCIRNPLCKSSGGLIDPTKCKTSVDTIKGLSAQFKDTCEKGPMTGAGGAGGAVGAGGAGGSAGNPECIPKCKELYACAKKTGE